MATVESIHGPLDTEQLGFTMMHEHVFVISPHMYDVWPHLLDRDAIVARAIEALKEAKAAGVDTMVDLTTPNMGRDIELMRRVASEADMNIVLATGVHPLLPIHVYFLACVGPRSEALMADDMEELFVRDIEVGVQGTDVKAGIIKLGTEPEMDPVNEACLRAGARAHRRTGVPISTHTIARLKVGLVQQDVFESEGVDLTRVVIGHSGDSSDTSYLSALIDRGSYIGMDRFGFTLPGLDMPTVEERVDTVRRMCELGHAGKMVLSHDWTCFTDFIPDEFNAEFQPDYKLTYINNDVIPMLKEVGVSDQDIEQMTVHNPRAIFEVQGAY